MKNCKNCGKPIVRRDKDNVMEGMIDNYYIHDREKFKSFRRCLSEDSTERKVIFLKDENNKNIIAE